MNLSGPHEHIYTTGVRTWDKAKAYSRDNRKAPRPPKHGFGKSCEPPG